MKKWLLLLFLTIIFPMPAWAQTEDEESDFEKKLLARAQNGDADAQYRLALFYKYIADDALAEKWAEMAVKNGKNEAITVLIDLLLQSSQFPKAYAKAEKAYTQGNSAALYSLADMLITGTGTEPDPSRAYQLLREASDNGDAHASGLLAYYLYMDDTPDKNYPLIVELAEKAASQDYNLHGNYILGRLYLYGQGVPQNFAKAREFFNRVANSDVENLMIGRSSCLAETLK